MTVSGNMSEEVNKLQNNIIGLTRFLNSYILQVLQELFDLLLIPSPCTMAVGEVVPESQTPLLQLVRTCLRLWLGSYSLK